ncbi:NlpC/P60 family protein [Niabella insulamsoli]|uniref:C40 family peptidase n=1 Tax=Niabella insulamsoli TaxID=3144874 RepID=UPI0031FBE279
MKHFDYGMVIVPAAPVRKKPNHRQEMSNQLLFGEAVKILGRKNATWIKIESIFDGYVGWTTSHLLAVTDEAAALKPCHTLAPQLLNEIRIQKQTMQLPLGASLRNLQHKRGSVGDIAFSFAEKPLNPTAIKDKKKFILKQARLWLNAPYMWGGKTILGVDCSGFCQTLYKIAGVAIARDAWEQALQGRRVRSLKTAGPGDLAFFEEDDKIVHVGLIIGDQQIIHASGKVRIDHLDKKGIIHSDTGERTHTLKLIRRFID